MKKKVTERQTKLKDVRKFGGKKQIFNQHDANSFFTYFLQQACIMFYNRNYLKNILENAQDKLSGEKEEL